MDIPQLLATWLHTLAFVIAWGYYGVLGRIVLPGLERSLDSPAQAKTLVTIERRALPLVGLSVILFIVTGTYLLLIDSRYAGLGDVSANTWTMLMFAKHLMVILLLALAVLVDVFVRRAGDATDELTRESALRRLRQSAEAATGVGALIVLLTTAAQLSA